MKADHRHELKTNELADWLAHFPQWAQENRTTLIAAGVAIVVLIGVYFVRFYRKDIDVRQHVQLTNLVTQVSAQRGTIAQAASQGTDQSVTLLPIAQDLQSFAQGSGNDHMAALALIKRAEALRSELHYRLTDPGREETAKQIAQAQSAYRTALERAASIPVLAATAQLGLGLCDEELGNFAEAKATYRKVAENADYDGTAAQAAAAHRVRRLPVPSGLLLPHGRVRAAGCHQIVVVPLLDDAAVSEHKDPVRHARRTQPVADEERRAAVEQLAEPLVQLCLCHRVHGCGGLVEDQQFGAAHESP